MRRNRYGRFGETLRNDWTADLLYRREAWVFRRLYGYWATPDQMRSLNRALARHFNVPEPTLVMRLSTNTRTGGWFRVNKLGAHHIFVRGARFNGTWETHAVSNQCKHYIVRGRARRGEYHVHTLLHEFSHYLAYCWWGDGAHDSRFAAVCEVTHAWYARRRKYETRRDVTYKLE